MKVPVCIIETPDVLVYLQTRGLVKQYQKAKNIILSGWIGGTSFKEKQPHGSNAWQFRINKQYRAIGFFDDKGQLKIISIDDHQ